MTFKFQINDEIRFRHDRQLLDKAEAFRPKMHPVVRKPVRAVELTKNESLLEGWDMAEIHADMEKMAFSKGQSIILDFGRHCTGRFSMDIRSVGSPMDAPLYLRLRFAEVPAELAHESEEYDGWLSRSWIQEEFIHLDVLPVRLELPRRYAFRYVELTVIDTSPKWAAVFTNPEVLCASSAPGNAETVPVPKDPELARIYEVGLHTLQECMTDVFEDGPKRDRRLWLGDLRLQALASYASEDNPDLVKRCLYLFAGMTSEEGEISANVFTQPSPQPDDTFLFDYSLFFASVLHDFLQQHPDEMVLEDLYPVAKKQMDLALQQVDEEGRLHLQKDRPVFVDWSQEFAKDTAGQAIMIYTLKHFIELTRMKREDTAPYVKQLEKLENDARNRLYDPEKKLFRAGEEGTEYNIASQVWMVLAGVFGQMKNREIMTEAIQQLFPVKGIATPYMYHHVTEALFQAGLKQEAVGLMKAYWGKMIELGADTYWEAFDPDQPDYSPYGSPIISSYCHAWSCTPVYLIHKYLLADQPA